MRPFPNRITRNPSRLASVIAVALMTPLIGHAEPDAPATETAMEAVRIAEDGNGFVLAESGKRFVPWGFNYLGRFEHLAEEEWAENWEELESDFREMRELGANVVRWHLQFGTYMTSAEETNADELARLRKLLDLAQSTGLYLDLTGLSCYHLDRIPEWYDGLDEAQRWQAQARFWAAIAETCAGHPAVFCYDLMNEPVITEPKEGEHPWLAGELGGFYFVQRICNKPAGRESVDIAEAWVKTLVKAIREHDKQTPITVGVIPWAQVWPNAKPLFYAPQVIRHLDFVSVHFYPGAGKIDADLKALAVYDLGKPLVIEEIFPLSCTMEELDQFIDGAAERTDGWISHYFGYTIEEHQNGAEPSGPLVAEFLKYWKEKGRGIVEKTEPE